jgi:tetratricopeptide (TPR) repeat protein
MTAPITFEDLARGAARRGAAAECVGMSDALCCSAEGQPNARREALERAARGLRVAARMLLSLGEAAPSASGFGPAGLAGALAAGHLALAAGRSAQAELIGSGIAEALPGSPAGLRLVGQALFAQGRFDLALRAYRGALAAAPRDRFTLALHAEALWFAGEEGAARSALAALCGSSDPGGRLAAAIEHAIRCGAVPPGGRGGRP